MLRSRSASVLGYTNNALTPEQRAAAITAVLGHAAAGRIRMAYDVLPLAEVEAAWARQATGAAAWSLRPGPGLIVPRKAAAETSHLPSRQQR